MSDLLTSKLGGGCAEVAVCVCWVGSTGVCGASVGASSGGRTGRPVVGSTVFFATWGVGVFVSDGLGVGFAGWGCGFCGVCCLGCGGVGGCFEGFCLGVGGVVDASGFCVAVTRGVF